MTPAELAAIAPLIVAGVSIAMLFSPIVELRARHTLLPMIAAAVLVLFAVTSPDGVRAYAALAVVALVHAGTAWRQSRNGAIALVAGALATGGAALALAADQMVAAFALSLLAIAFRSGVMPLHAGVASLSERAPALQAQQFASTLALVFLHLRWVDHHQTAYDAAPLIVRFGAAVTLIPALLALVQKDLRGLYRCAVVMHGGMLFAAVGAAGHGHYAAALLVALTMCVAVSGLGLLMSALEDRAGRVMLNTFGGRMRAFPRLTAAFAFFGAAGVAMPGTAGFIADDLFLHALWEESVAGTTAVIVAAACLAVATLTAFSRAFLGPPRPSPAPDLLMRERVVVVVLVIVLVTLGLFPTLVLQPAEALLG